MNRLLLTLLLMVPVAGHATEKQCEAGTEWQRNRMACLVTTISWVEVTHQGSHADIFKKEKANLERFIRLRLHNDLSTLSHETLDWISALEMAGEVAEIPSAAYTDFLDARSQVVCNLFWVGETDYPIAYYTECEILRLVNYRFMGDEIKQIHLGYTNRSDLIEDVKEVIRGNIESIASQFYAQRDLEVPE